MNKPNRQASLTWHTPAKDYLNGQELAEWLGVSPRTVVNLRRRRVLPHIQIGRLVRFSRTQVESALQTYTVAALRIPSKK